MENRIHDISQRIKELRDILGIDAEEMARCTELPVDKYLELESGNSDFTFTFIYKCAKRFGVDVTDILKGSSPTLSSFSVTRAGQGLPIARRHGFTYDNLAPMFKGKLSEPFLVCAKYSTEAEAAPVVLASHSGQEIDIIISGKLKITVGENTEILSAGDTAYYNSQVPHGMVAVGGEDCYFYSVVIGGEGESAMAEDEGEPAPVQEANAGTPADSVAAKYIETTVDENRIFSSIKFKNTENFNFAYDVVDALAEKCPDKLAMLHLDVNKNERRMSFAEMSRESTRTANYFRSLGIERGDKVLLVLKRHYQFWYAILALHKLGAIVIPATNQLVKKDFEYRFNAAGVKAVVSTDDGDVANQIDLAAPDCPTLECKIIVGNTDKQVVRQGWHSFNLEQPAHSDKMERVMAGGQQPMLMFFTSGTTGYPKIAVHSFLYPLGHYPTARFWHHVDPNGIHFTISDTGWGKALWGKLYGQWLCEAAVFTYDFDRFHAADILPLFAKYGITTFCAPPTMYRFFIKEDLSKYDLSSVKHATIAGEALNPEVYEQFKKATGLSLTEGFGQTETTLAIAYFKRMKVTPGAMGYPSPLYNVDLVDPNGNSVGVGETGEIIIRADRNNPPCGLFLGYYNNDADTDHAWRGGYYHTGDTAWRDENGCFHYVGRVDDLIKSSGYRIGPFEIESVIMELPYVLECAVTAAPDEIRGQVVKASIVLTKDATPSDELKKEIQKYVKEHTAPYKYPRIVEFLDELPKTISGKIRRVELRGK